jgi:hypothetical protein
MYEKVQILAVLSTTDQKFAAKIMLKLEWMGVPAEGF